MDTKNSEIYDDEFYKNRHLDTLHSAKTILHLVQEIIPKKIESVLDVGCGVGTWLSVCKTDFNASVHGFDGPWVPTQYLQIAQDEFTPCAIDKLVSTRERERERACNNT